MCEICLKWPCDPRCPNAPDPPTVYICSGCGKNILDGDDYWDIFGEQLCESCIDESRRTAEVEDY